VIARTAPQVDGRDSDAVLKDFEDRRSGYVPRWNPPAKSAGAAIGQIGARFIAAILQRLNRAPLKEKLAFLDFLGLRLVPAQSARAPIVFQLGPDAASTSAPEGTQVAAPPPPGSSQQIVFSTERDAGIAAAKLTEVLSLWPGRDEYIDHSGAHQTGQPFTLFEHLRLRQTDHILYLAHDTFLALAGSVRLDVIFDLAQGSSAPLELTWEYWDSKVWRGFMSHRASCLDPDAAGADGTNGLSLDGTVHLVADAAQTAPTTVNGLESHWIRGYITQPLPPDPATLLPLVETIRLRTLIDQRLEVTVTVSFLVPNVPRTSLTVKDESGQPLGPVVVTLSEPANANSPVLSEVVPPPDANHPDGKVYPQWKLATGHTYQFDVSPQSSIGGSGMPSILGRATVEYLLTDTTADIEILVKVGGLKPDKAVLNGKNLDVTKVFYPFGQASQLDTALYFKQTEIFSKPMASVQLFIEPAVGPFDPDPSTNKGPIPHIISWEYWNGDEWTVLFRSTNSTTPSRDFTALEIIEFTVPDDMVPTKVNNEDGLWMRARLVSGGYGINRHIPLPPPPPTATFNYVEPQPPVLAAFRFGYSWVQGPVPLEAVVTYNDFQYEDHTEDALWPGNPFKPFGPVSDATPTLYLGFDGRLPIDNFGIYIDVEEHTGDPAPALVWEYWDGGDWRGTTVDDETRQLQTAGMVSFIPAADSQALARFDTPLHWLRGRLKEDGPPSEAIIRRIYPNAVWASQWQTFRKVPLGASTGTPNQIFQFSQIPVLEGEAIEVKELSGPRANTEWRTLAMEVAGGDSAVVRELEAMLAAEGTETDVVLGVLHLTRDKTKHVTAVAVRWEERRNFFDSGPNDRHYVLDHATGRLFFGSGDGGMIPPPAAAIEAALFRSGGGLFGNVPPRTITQLLGSVAGVQAITNPRAAEGGADGETLEAFAARAPLTIRNRGCAIGPQDYETMAREASAGVAVARAIPTRNPSGLTLPGWVTVMIIPRSQEPRPVPSSGLRDEVREHLEQHAPCDVAAAHRIQVIGPTYLPINVTARIAPKDPRRAGTVERDAAGALGRFLHPLYGGPDGLGWDLGRGVFVSDVAAVLGDVAGVDYVEELSLSANGILQGDHVEVPPDQIVVAGLFTFSVVTRGNG
jgi:hypothetical protein